MKWEQLNAIEQLDQIDALSNTQAVLLFKHSTRCSISDAAISMFEREWTEEDSSKMKPYYLDLIAYRPVSNAIAERYHVEHESPQVLVIKNGKCVYNESHMNIRVNALREQM